MPTFKDYSMDQLQLPLSFKNLIPENHLFRVVNTIVDSLDMKDIIEDVFYEVVKLLIEKKYISLKNYFLDGTKIEANANKCTFVWNKSIKNYD